VNLLARAHQVERCLHQIGLDGCIVYMASCAPCVTAAALGCDRCRNPAGALRASGTVAYVALLGMPGVGKTTIAKAVLEAVKGSFTRIITVVVGQTPNIRGLLIKVWEQEIKATLPQELLSREHFKAPDACSILAEKVGDDTLLLLDDVWTAAHLEALSFATFKPKTRNRVLVTTRSLRAVGWLPESARNIFRVEELSDDGARRLLCKHAFDTDAPPLGAEWARCVTDVVECSQKLPLTLSVRFLLALAQGHAKLRLPSLAFSTVTSRTDRFTARRGCTEF
jgi:NB-ARC domain